MAGVTDVENPYKKDRIFFELFEVLLRLSEKRVWSMSSELLPAEDREVETETGPEDLRALRYIRFGSFDIDQQRQQVHQNGARIKLQGKVYQVLLTLVLRQGDIVTREELKQALWPADTYVNYDANVNTTVNKLRQVLGDSTDKPVYIETIPRKGYVFVGHAEFSATAFPPRKAKGPAEEKLQPGGEGRTGELSRKWITVGIGVLILTGILLGAGLAMLLISHFGPKHF